MNADLRLTVVIAMFMFSDLKDANAATHGVAVSHTARFLNIKNVGETGDYEGRAGAACLRGRVAEAAVSGLAGADVGDTNLRNSCF